MPEKNDLLAQTIGGPSTLPENRPTFASMPWYTSRGRQVLRTGDLARILRYYRQFHRMSQEELAAQMMCSRSYISRIENGERRPANAAALTRALGIPSHAVEHSGTWRSDYLDILLLGTSVVRLARTAREAGRAVRALEELQPLVAALELRVQQGKADRGALRLLAAAYVELGVALGDILPEEHLGSAARWTGAGASIAEELDEPRLLSHTLRMQGNELRKAGARDQSATVLERALAMSASPMEKAAGAMLLARRAGESGDAITLDRCLRICHAALDRNRTDTGFFLNAFSLREVELRGFLLTHRPGRAASVAQQVVDRTLAPPQWDVIERVTMGQFHLEYGDREAAAVGLYSAVDAARSHQLPHQIQRVIRLAGAAGLDGVAQAGSAALQCLAFPPPAGGTPSTGGEQLTA